MPQKIFISIRKLYKHALLHEKKYEMYSKIH